MPQSSSRVFQTIEIGDPDDYARALEEFNRAEAFLEANGAMVKRKSLREDRRSIEQNEKTQPRPPPLSKNSSASPLHSPLSTQNPPFYSSRATEQTRAGKTRKVPPEPKYHRLSSPGDSSSSSLTPMPPGPAKTSERSVQGKRASVRRLRKPCITRGSPSIAS